MGKGFSVKLFKFVALPLIAVGFCLFIMKWIDEPEQPILQEESAQTAITTSNTDTTLLTKAVDSTSSVILAAKNDSLNQVVTNTKQPIKILCSSVDLLDASNSLKIYNKKVVQITGYATANDWSDINNSSSLNLFSTIKKCFDGTDNSSAMCEFSAIEPNPFSNQEKGVLKMTVKGLLDYSDSGLHMASLTNCYIIENQFLPLKSCEQYLRHPSWASMMRSTDLIGSKVVVNARVVQIVGTSTLASMGRFGNNIFVDDNSYDTDKRLVDGDYIKIVGKFTGTKEYTTVLGADMSVPEIDPDYITYIGRRDE
jgi:hypothetical protein